MLIAFVFALICTGTATGQNSLFKEEPRNQSVLLGQNVLLRCAAQASSTGEALHSQWRGNDGALLGLHEAGVLAGHDGRYSYVRENADEKHLYIEKVTLDDDGRFECQMMRPPSIRGFRSSAYVNVIVAPREIKLLNYRPGSVIDVNEGTLLNISCESPNAKPPASLNWYVNGKKTIDNVQWWSKNNQNRTVTSYAALVLVPNRTDDKRVLTCESLHETGDQRRVNVTLNVLYPSERPRIELVTGKTSLKAGENVTMLCSAVGGNPPPNVTWVLNQRIIGSNFHYDYTTKETRNIYSMVVEASDNNAKYECHSLNRIGGEPLKETLRLSVAYAPLGVDIYGEGSIRLHDTAVMQCRSRLSNPRSRIIWLINGQPVQARSDGEVHDEHPGGTTTLSNITVVPTDVHITNHQIVVECIARNEEGSASKQHVLRVLSPPLEPVIYGADGEALLEGEILNLTCEAHGGNPLAALSWYRGIEKLKETRSAVSGDTSQSMLSIVLDRTMNNQQIRCRAENGALDEPLIATKFITVLFPPRRVLIRQDERTRRPMVAGEATRLLCIVPSSNPAADVTWQFTSSSGEETLRGTNRLNRTSREYGGFEVENVLEFTPTENMDGTDMRCIASHSQWNEEKIAPYPLKVLYAPQSLVKGPISITLSEGQNFRENLTVRANPPVAAWRWRKDGIPFEHTIGGVFAKGPIFSGRSVTGEDSGLYTLVANNSIGSVNITIFLNIEYAARVTHITSPVMAASGEEVVLECEVDGVPRREGMVKWLRGDTPMKTVSLIGETRAVLRLNASIENSGVYTCVADNGIGKPNRTVAYLLVNKPPSITRHPSLLRAAGPISGRARLRCQAHAVPGVEFRWIVQGSKTPIRYNSTKYSFYTVQLDHSTFESTLWISELDRHDYQRPVKCIAENRLGEDMVEVTVGPPTAPDVPSALRVTNSSQTSMLLNWMHGFDGGSEQIFEIKYQTPNENFYKTVNSTTPSVELNGLHPAWLYEISVRALNARGSASEYSRPPLLAYTKDENGVDVINIEEKKDPFPKSLMVTFGVGGVTLLLINCLLLCYMHRRQKKKKMQEKTEMVRKVHGATGEVRPVQMYGALTNTESPYRPESANTNRSELGLEPVSEDDQSVRTMIEVNPNGYVQQIDSSGCYDRECLVEYDFDPSLYADVVRSGTLRRGPPTYTNTPYPEPPTDEISLGAPSVGYSEGSVKRSSDLVHTGSPRRIHVPRSVDPANYHAANSTNGTPQMLSTFMQPGGVHTAPLDYAHIDGDLV